MRGSSHVGSSGKSPACPQSQNQDSNGSHSQNTTAGISIVGLGPGDACLLAPLAVDAIARADSVVGYTTYIQLIPETLLAGKNIIETGMTGEVDRCERAILEAANGKETVVVSSGDPGVYGMAGLVIELLEQQERLDDIPCRVVPGISAATAAAARLGAPLTHDFAIISLSDLLTPWETIATRLDLAAQADFVIVLYNPRSKRRKDHLPNALEIIGRHREPTTPVGLVREAYRPQENVMQFTLSTVDVDAVDMLSILIVGNSTTRMAGSRMLTPRGYAEKYELREMKKRR